MLFRQIKDFIKKKHTEEDCWGREGYFFGEECAEFCPDPEKPPRDPLPLVSNTKRAFPRG